MCQFKYSILGGHSQNPNWWFEIIPSFNLNWNTNSIVNREQILKNDMTNWFWNRLIKTNKQNLLNITNESVENFHYSKNFSQATLCLNKIFLFKLSHRFISHINYPVSKKDFYVIHLLNEFLDSIYIERDLLYVITRTKYSCIIRGLNLQIY